MEGRITVSVDADVADAYRAASDGDRRKLDLLVNLRLREATHSERPLRDIMRGHQRQRAAARAHSGDAAFDSERGVMGVANTNVVVSATGDADLLAMDPFRGTRIVTPADFLQAGD